MPDPDPEKVLVHQYQSQYQFSYLCQTQTQKQCQYTSTSHSTSASSRICARPRPRNSASIPVPVTVLVTVPVPVLVSVPDPETVPIYQYQSQYTCQFTGSSTWKCGSLVLHWSARWCSRDKANRYSSMSRLLISWIRCSTSPPRSANRDTVYPHNTYLFKNSWFHKNKKIKTTGTGCKGSYSTQPTGTVRREEWWRVATVDRHHELKPEGLLGDALSGEGEEWVVLNCWTGTQTLDCKDRQTRDQYQLGKVPYYWIPYSAYPVWWGRSEWCWTAGKAPWTPAGRSAGRGTKTAALINLPCVVREEWVVLNCWNGTLNSSWKVCWKRYWDRCCSSVRPK